MSERPQLAWVDGVLAPRDEARLSIDDFSVRYGAACFETMLARHGRVFRLDAHLDRLERGLRAMRVRQPSREALAQAVAATLRANELDDASVRLSVTAGRGGAPDLARAAGPSVIVTADALPAPSPPVRLRIVSTRIEERRALADAKTAQFLPYLLARAEAREAGADDALLLNHAGAVAEAATANIFALFDGVLVTPPRAGGPLPGVTRAAVLEVAHALGLPCAERTLHPADLARAEGAFLTSSVQGIVPVASIDAEGLAWRAPSAQPNVARTVREAYEALVERECGGESPT